MGFWYLIMSFLFSSAQAQRFSCRVKLQGCGLVCCWWAYNDFAQASLILTTNSCIIKSSIMNHLKSKNSETRSHLWIIFKMQRSPIADFYMSLFKIALVVAWDLNMFAALQSQEILGHWLNQNLLSKNKTKKPDEVSKTTQKRTDQNINDQSYAKHIQSLLLLTTGSSYLCPPYNCDHYVIRFSSSSTPTSSLFFLASLSVTFSSS